MSSRAIRVEITIAADLDTVWRLTQDPVAHARWDARFSRIVPTEAGERGQRFRYERGMLVRTIRGTGISLGSRLGADGARTSALRFATTDRLSPLRDGRGYWRYEPVDGGVRFLTGYDYAPGWSTLLDRVLVRPLVAWMTAYSFARLRRWAERGDPPERWPLWRAELPWPRDRPRASDCTWSIGRPAAMSDAPAHLAELAAPFLHIGRIRNILAPYPGEHVPFTVENYAYRDPFGRETVTFVRTFHYPDRPGRPGRFDATMILGATGRIVDYLGTHQHLAVDLDLSVEADGSLRLRSDAQRFSAGPLAFPFPMLFSGRADLRESFDDEAGEYVIRLEVRNRVFGFLFGYEGRFTYEFPGAVEAPAHVLPRRHDRRE